jgi:hypothetical protein
MREFDLSFIDERKRPARHRVRLYPLDNWTTVIATDRSEKYKCASITNTIGQLVNALIAREHLNPERLVVIEHYDDLDKESFDLVRFDRLRDGLMHYPSWKAISKEEALEWAGQGGNHATKGRYESIGCEREHRGIGPSRTPAEAGGSYLSGEEAGEPARPVSRRPVGA